MRYLLLFLLALPNLSHALTVTVSNAGGNWSANGTWTGGAPPGVGDDVVVTATSGQLTGNNGADTCKTLNLTGYTSTFTNNQGLVVAGSITLAGTIAGTANITMSATGTITSNGKTFPGSFTFGGPAAAVYTLADNMIVTGAVSTNNNAPAINGNQITCNGSFTAGTGGNTGTTLVLMGGTGTLTASSSAVQNNITINTAGTITLGNINYATGTFTYTAGTIVTGNTLTIRNSATFNTSGMNFNNVSVNITSGTIVTMTSAFNCTGTMVLGTATVSMTFSGAFAVSTGALTLSGGTTTLSSNTTVTGDFLMNSGTTLAGSFNLNVGGNATNSSTSGLVSTTTTLVMTGTGNLSSSAPNGQFNLPIVINTAGTITFGQMFAAGANTTLTVTSGSVDIATNHTIMCPGSNITTPYLGQAWKSFSYSQTRTLTLSADLSIPESLIIWANGSNVNGVLSVNGAFNMTCGNLVVGTNDSLVIGAGRTLTVNTGLYVFGYPSPFTNGTILFSTPNVGLSHIRSGTASSSINLKFLGAPTGNQVYSATFTDVDASLSTYPIFNYNGTASQLTRCTNIRSQSLPALRGCGDN